MSALKQRELLLNASNQGRRLNVQIVSESVRLELWPPNPAVPANPSARQINQYLATQANTSTLAMVRKTGIGSANTVGMSPQELARLQVAEPVVMWEYSKMGHPNYTEIILKTGAGNCDQMAHVAKEMIRTNGGVAQVWGTQPPAHAFVVVGRPPAGLARTRDFQEAGWADVWISDPWTSISCAAGDYIAQLNIKMTEWFLQDISVYFHDAGAYRWAQANDPAWLARLTQSDKLPMP